MLDPQVLDIRSAHHTRLPTHLIIIIGHRLGIGTPACGFTHSPAPGRALSTENSTLTREQGAAALFVETSLLQAPESDSVTDAHSRSMSVQRPWFVSARPATRSAGILAWGLTATRRQGSASGAAPW